ncbi:MAG: Bor family protein [Gemmatimonadales bacterium]|nr:Bor family protein [Gemmatimonadales bacterium]
MPKRSHAVQPGAALALFVLAGCYHATVDTGATPGPQTIRKPFASAWIYGLVPPSTVETEARCPTGVARIETRRSLVNYLVNFLTLGIYTPMQIDVTCAAPIEGVDGIPRRPAPPDTIAAARAAETDQTIRRGPDGSGMGSAVSIYRSAAAPLPTSRGQTASTSGRKRRRGLTAIAEASSADGLTHGGKFPKLFSR